MPSRRTLRLIASVLLLATAFASDVLTGTEVASSLFYVVAISFGAWFECFRYTTLKADGFKTLGFAMIAQSCGRVAVQLGLG